MTLHTAPEDREPKGDHNRRLSLGLDPDQFAATAGITSGELRRYEQSLPGDPMDLEVARRIGEALEKLETDPPATQRVQN